MRRTLSISALTFATAACSVATDLAAADLAAVDLAAAPSGTAADVLGPWLRFYASYDATLDADLAEGVPAPVRVEGTPSFVEGRFGRSLLAGVKAGGARADYPVTGNIDLARPGGLSFWLSPTGWTDATVAGEAGYVRFVGVMGVGPAVFVVQRDVRRGEQERLLVGFFELPGHRSHFLSVRPGPRWGNGGWHLVAVSWDASGFAVSLDGGLLVRKAVPEGRVLESYGKPPAAAALILGDRTQESYRLDDFAVYTRALREEDIAALWAAAD